MANFTKKKKCPFCGYKNNPVAVDCEACGLNFTQLKDCSNKEAKETLKHRRFGETFEGEIVDVAFYPNDVKKVRFFLLAILLGLFGAHNFYVGKYVKGWLSLILGAIFTICVFVVASTVELGTGIANLFFNIGLFAGVYPIITWLFDLVAILFKGFRFPVKLKKPVDLPEEDEE